MGRRRIPREPEVRVAVRAEGRQPEWFEATAIATIALLSASLAGLWWLGASGLAP